MLSCQACHLTLQSTLPTISSVNKKWKSFSVFPAKADSKFKSNLLNIISTRNFHSNDVVASPINTTSLPYFSSQFFISIGGKELTLPRRKKIFISFVEDLRKFSASNFHCYFSDRFLRPRIIFSSIGELYLFCLDLCCDDDWVAIGTLDVCLRSFGCCCVDVHWYIGERGVDYFPLSCGFICCEVVRGYFLVLLGFHRWIGCVCCFPSYVGYHDARTCIVSLSIQRLSV